MIIIRLTYLVPLQEVDKYLSAHREFLDYHYKQGLLVASGPMKPRNGGIIIVNSKNRPEVEELFKKDPFYLAEIADYDFIEFTPIKHCEALRELIQKSEGKLC